MAPYNVKTDTTHESIKRLFDINICYRVGGSCNTHKLSAFDVALIVGSSVMNFPPYTHLFLRNNMRSSGRTSGCVGCKDLWLEVGVR